MIGQADAQVQAPATDMIERDPIIGDIGRAASGSSIRPVPQPNLSTEASDDGRRAL